MAPSPKHDGGPRVADLIEEAVHLLRQHPRELAGYYAATGPFAMALLYYWAYVTWFAPADGEVAAGALLLALLFGMMKAGQHRFAQRLLARRLAESPGPWGARQWLGEAAVQLRLQWSGVVLVPLAVLFGVPFGWVYGYYQNATVLPAGPGADSADRRVQAWDQIQLWPAQNHWALLILSGLWLMVFLNVAVAFYLVPALFTRWLGLQTIFAVDGWSHLNTTFLALVAVLTHLLVDPLVKAFYVLRVFHGRARRTGIDLRLVLAREKSFRARLGTTVGLVVLALALSGTPVGRATEAAAPVPPAAPAAQLDSALDRVLAQPEFRWRLRPLPVPANAKKEGIIKGFVRATIQTIAQVVRTVYRGFSRMRRWVADLFPGRSASDDPAGAAAARRDPFVWMTVLQVAAYGLLLAVVALLLFVAWKVWQHNRQTVPLAAPAPLPAGTPDLRDENIEASRLPADGWLDLARQQMAAGEWRLALRALFLATLARHAHAGLLSLAKFKTNLDYETELHRRAHSRPALVEDFRGRRRQFEEVWYGAAPASDTLVRDWLQHLEVHA
jgi:hypothetical protein